MVVAMQLRRLLRGFIGRGQAPEPEGVKDAYWYDKAFTDIEQYRRHYTESGYYFIWTVIADRILRSDTLSVLDLGCGPGQLAWLLHDKGITAYHGIDFSPVTIRMARERGLPFTFAEGDLTKPETLDEVPLYDTVVTLEFLEHIEGDLDILARLKPGSRLIATVPNFPYVSHVRHFRDASEVADRYSALFSDFRVDTFLENARGKTFFLMEGVKR